MSFLTQINAHYKIVSGPIFDIKTGKEISTKSAKPLTKASAEDLQRIEKFCKQAKVPFKMKDDYAQLDNGAKVYLFTSTTPYWDGVDTFIWVGGNKDKSGYPLKDAAQLKEYYKAGF